jgi:3-oxoacyl-[acyl-carrier protein] reductase
MISLSCANMRGHVAIVTGGGSGIGRATCLALAERGVNLGVVDLDLNGAERVAAEVVERGVEAIPCQVDVSSSAQVQESVARVVAAWHRIDILVNCAGMYKIGTINDVSEEDWDRMLGVNLKGQFLVCKAVVPVMQQQRSGAIVNVSSISGRTTSMMAGPHYVASKAGVIGLSMCLANQLARDGIRVNCVAPGTIDTPMNAFLEPEQYERLKTRVPLGRLGRPEEVAAAITYLASPEASYITGETLNVNGGVFMI